MQLFLDQSRHACDKTANLASFCIATECAFGLLEVQVLLPGHQEFPFLLLLTSFEALPIYAALLAAAWLEVLLLPASGILPRT